MPLPRPLIFFSSSSIFPPLHLPLFLLLFLFCAPSSFVLSLQCYECFDSSRTCTRSSNCTGSACILYENMPNRTSIAFCLLISPVAQQHGTDSVVQGCWRDGEGAGVQCVCSDEFCNLPRDQWTSDPNTEPIAGLRWLDRNPFVDYEYLDEERALIGSSTSSNQTSTEELEAMEALEDLEVPDLDTEQDLMPMNFSDYLDWEERVRFRNQTDTSSSDPEKQIIQQNETSSSRSTEVPSSSSADRCIPPIILLPVAALLSGSRWPFPPANDGLFGVEFGRLLTKWVSPLTLNISILLLNCPP